MFMGKPFEGAPWINTYSNVLVGRIWAVNRDANIIEGHSVPGTFSRPLAMTVRQPDLIGMNANAYDPNTYFVAPNQLRENWTFIGTQKYLMYTDGGGIAQGDTIQVGAKRYQVLMYNVAGWFWAIRII